MKKKVKGLIIVLALVGILFVGFFIYTLDYYRADISEIEDIITSTSVSVISDGNLTFFYPDEQNDISTAFIFYPGGKVEHTSYTPILIKLAEKGVTGILVKMPFNLSVFNINAADKIFDELPDIKSWYIGGHSLGGAMASSYASKNRERLDGLILLAAYPTNELSIPLIAIYGSNDGVLNTSKLQNVSNIIKIEGGNHAYFGNYGEQDKDGVATITREEQQDVTVEQIIDFIESNR